jgi:hypothetical protein
VRRCVAAGKARTGLPKGGAAIRRGVALAFLLTTALCLSCGSCNGGSISSEEALRPTLPAIQRQVFDLHCTTSGCHRGPVPESRLNLEEGESYRNLVNIRSVQIGDLMRVAPNDPGESYLIRKLEGREIVGERMPNAGEPLPAEVIDVIREWIDSGAPDGGP